MAKRPHSESIAANDAPIDANDASIRKKSRKDKKSKKSAEPASLDEAAANGSEVPSVTSQNGEDKDQEQEAKEDGAHTAEIPAPATNGTSDGAAKTVTAERKALKRAKRAAKEAADPAGVQQPGTNGEAESAGDADAKAAAKAARKEEKARLKVAKKEEKKRAKAQTTASDTATIDGLTSNGTSAAPSKAQSSATSLEPTPAPEFAASGGYVQDPALTALPQSDIDDYLTSNHIAISDSLKDAPAYRPIISFSHLPITDEAQRAPFASFSSPTPIQAAAWPALFAGRDVIGVAETGSGKTLAFGVPCIRYIQSLPAAQRQRGGVKAAIVSPTRELACQIHEQLAALCGPARLRAAVVYGGVGKDEQRAALRGASIVVATPGRLNDLIGEGAADLSGVGYLVLDEADRMLDKGFEQDVRKIVGATPAPPRRQTVMFTATWPASVRELAASFMAAPVRVSIGDNPAGELRANARIRQTVEVVEPRGKEQRLLQLLREHQSGASRDERILVFCLYKKEATRVENLIRARGLRVAGIHGDLGQAQRTASLDAFKKGSVPLLVATDVAARGLDIPAVKLVINVTFPLTVEDYVHRIGR